MSNALKVFATIKPSKDELEIIQALADNAGRARFEARRANNRRIFERELAAGLRQIARIVPRPQAQTRRKASERPLVRLGEVISRQIKLY